MPPFPQPRPRETVAAVVGSTLARGIFVVIFAAVTALLASHLVSTLMR